MKALIIIAALAGTAHADGWEGSTAIQIGDLPFGSYDGGGIGARLDAGHRWDRLLLVGELGFADEDGRIDDATEHTRGYGTRVGAAARWDLLRHAISQAASVELVLDGGVGEEYLRWARGGSIHRPDLSFGFAAEMRIRDRGTVLGFSTGLEFLLAHSPALVGDGPRCGGPCYAPSSPLSWDLGVLYTIAFRFGR